MLAQNNDQLTPEDFILMLLKELEEVFKEEEQELVKDTPKIVLEIQHIEDVLEILEAHLEEEDDREVYPQKYFPEGYMPRIDELSNASIIASLKKKSLKSVIAFLNFTADAL